MKAPSLSLDALPVPSPSVAEHLIALLHHLGVEQAYGLVGGAIAPLCDALGRGPLTCFQLRHEAGALFAACEASLATGRPVAAFVTTGPGLTNALTGALAARWEGAKVILISGATSAAQRGRWAVQETSAHTLPASGVFTAGPVFDYAATIEHVDELGVVAQRLASGVDRPGGFVAHVSLPIALQLAKLPRLSLPAVTLRNRRCDDAIVETCASTLRTGAPVVWVGFGARHASAEIHELVARTGARVMCTPRGKGVFSEADPRFLGVTGCGGHDAVERALAAAPPDHILVLGTRLGEFSSCWSRGLTPRTAFLHVDVNADVFGAAYPDVPTIGIEADIAPFLRAVLARLETRATPAVAARPPAVPAAHDEALLALPRLDAPVRPRTLMAAIQARIVDGSDALVMAESGNAFAWTNHELVFAEPGRYRVSGMWGSMGHATSGVVGAALGRQGAAVAVVGDGAMLMMNEVSSAVQYGAHAVWIVLNDAQMGIVDRGMALQGFTPFHTQLPSTDFAALARALGAVGVRVDHEGDLDAALDLALTAGRPCVIDVRIDPREYAPFTKRISTLVAMGASSTT